MKTPRCTHTHITLQSRVAHIKYKVRQLVSRIRRTTSLQALPPGPGRVNAIKRLYRRLLLCSQRENASAQLRKAAWPGVQLATMQNAPGPIDAARCAACRCAVDDDFAALLGDAPPNLVRLHGCWRLGRIEPNVYDGDGRAVQ